MVRRHGRGISCVYGQPVLGGYTVTQGQVEFLPLLQPPLARPFSSNLNTGRPEE